MYKCIKILLVTIFIIIVLYYIFFTILFESFITKPSRKIGNKYNNWLGKRAAGVKEIKNNGLNMYVFENNESDIVFLCFHGRKCNITHCMDWYVSLWGNGTVVGVDYKGYGASDDAIGGTTIKTMADDALSVFEYVKATWPNKKIIAVGHSLGSLFALSVPADAFVIEGGFRNFSSIGLIGPGQSLYDLPQKMKEMKPGSKILFIHGVNDIIVPQKECNKLKNVAIENGHDVTVSYFYDGHSVSETNPEGFHNVIYDFISKI